MDFKRASQALHTPSATRLGDANRTGHKPPADVSRGTSGIGDRPQICRTAEGPQPTIAHVLSLPWFHVKQSRRSPAWH